MSIELIFACFSYVIAGPISDSVSKANPGTELSIQAIMVGGLAIIGGLFVCFSGLKLFRTALFLAGFILFSNLANIILERMDLNFQGYKMIIVCFACGIIGGFTSQAFWRFGLSIIGFVAGSCFGITLLTLKSGYLFDSDLKRLLLIIAIGIIGAVLIQVIERPILIISTALTGATVTVFGLDVFIKTGYSSAVLDFLQGVQAGDNPGDYIYDFTLSIGGMIACLVILTIVGIISQSHGSSGYNYRK